MFPESAKLTPLNGTGDPPTANPTTYPWYSRLNIVPDSIDFPIPIRKKEKQWDIGSGKHASHVVNTEYEPAELTLEMLHQDARFLALAGGTCTSAGTQAEVTSITCLAASSITQSDYFLVYGIDDSDHVEAYQVWFDIDTDGTAPSLITGTTEVKVGIASTDTAAQVAGKLDTALDAHDFYPDTTDAVITLTNANDGSVPDARDYNTGFTISVTTQGASTHTFTEQLDNTLKTFGLHAEWENGDEDICADYFGCIVSNYELTIDYEEKLVKESVTVMCPYYVVGNISIHNPPIRRSMDPAVYGNLGESENNYILMVGTTDRTPAIVTQLTLTIENEVDLLPEIGYNYRQYAICGKRNISMGLVGFIQTNDIWTHWKDTWDDSAGYYTNAGGRLNSEIKITREATYDNWQLSIYNWLVDEYAMKLFSIDDKILGCEIKFIDATPNSTTGYMMDSLLIKDYMEKLVYGVANS